MTTGRQSPRPFFEDILRPSYEAWLADPLAEWKAKAAVANADIMAERVFVYWDGHDQTKVAGADSIRKYRSHIVTHMCPEFGLAWDIHDGHKHVSLRAPRRVTRSDQTGVSRMGFGQGGYGEGGYGGAEEIIVTLDDGSKRALSAIMKKVVAMWGAELVAMGL
ncbi:hypothetical protein [Methylobacterium sp. A54F]